MHLNLDQFIQFGYAGIVLALVLEFLALPIPGEEILIFCGFLTVRGDFNLWGALIAACVGSLLGFFVAFTLGRRFGRPLLEQYGRYMRLHGRHLDTAERLFNRYQWPLLLAGRYVIGVRHAVPYLAGFSELTVRQFTLANLIGTVVWVIPLMYAGRALGARWGLVMAWLNRFGLWLLAAGALAAGIAALAYWLRRRKGRAV
ncbi:MAG TPA: DedA family protein [Limnochordia bacterium]|nr:DedA family protein [Limnochordia bacterium]